MSERCINGDGGWVGENWTQADRWNESTRVCVCGASITWEGISDLLKKWVKVHAACKVPEHLAKHYYQMPPDED